jgi:hypothetical protein
MGRNKLLENICGDASREFFYAESRVSTPRMHPSGMDGSPIQGPGLQDRSLRGLIR